MRGHAAAVLAVACVMAGSAVSWGANRGASANASADAGQGFVNAAYERSRAATQPAGVQEAEDLLRMALQVDPGNEHTLRLLVEAATARGDAETQKEALRQLIQVAPKDLVAQVQYIDLLASETQAIDQRARVYQSALDKTSLDPQVRSEMAVRLARIAIERADAEGARPLVKRALELNDVNVEALREWVQLSRTPEERLGALVALLNANPLQPAAWVDAARVLEASNLHSQAADYLVTALEQLHLQGEQAPADVYLAVGIDLAVAGRKAEAAPILAALAKLPDAPLNALVAARLLANEYTPPATRPMGGGTPTTQPSTDELDGAIRKQLSSAVQAAGNDHAKLAAALAEGLWIELSVLGNKGGGNGPVNDWMQRYQQLVPAEDPTVARFQGWQQYRQGKLDEARQTLEKAMQGASDPFSQLGLGRVLMAQGSAKEATEQLHDLWWTHPTGVFAYQVMQAAREGVNGKPVALTPTMSSQKLLAILGRLPSTALVAHRNIRDVILVETSLAKQTYDRGEPVLLRVRINNTSDHAISVGADGEAKTTVAVKARVGGMDAANLGVVAVDDLQRAYRLESRGHIDGEIRVDQGPLASYLLAHPTQSYPVSLMAVTAPRGSMNSPVAGLGGQSVPVGDFDRHGGPAPKPEEVAARVAHATSSPEKVNLLMTLPQDLSDEVKSKLDGLATDGDPAVRAAWAWRTFERANAGKGPARDEDLGALRRERDAEKDGTVKELMASLVKELEAPPK